MDVQLHCVGCGCTKRAESESRAAYERFDTCVIPAANTSCCLFRPLYQLHPYCAVRAVDASTHIASRVWDTIAYSLSAAAVLGHRVQAHHVHTSQDCLTSAGLIATFTSHIQRIPSLCHTYTTPSLQPHFTAMRSQSNLYPCTDTFLFPRFDHPFATLLVPLA